MATEAREIVIFEAKLTLCRKAFQQLAFYKRVVEFATHKPVLCVVVCKNLVKKTDMKQVLGRIPVVCDTIQDALSLAQYDIPVLHWLGRSPLIPREGIFAPLARTALASLPSRVHDAQERST